jgi:hypothetical protein
MLPPGGDTILASCSNEAVPGRVETKCCRAFPTDTAYTERLVLGAFSQRSTHSNQNRRHVRDVHFLWTNRGLVPRQADFIFGQIRTDATLQACAYSGQIGPRAASSGLLLRSNRNRRDAPGVRLLGPNQGLVPRQADFFFGQIGTDATLQACAYSGQIRASCRVKRTSSSVKSGPTRHSRRALTQAKSGPCAASSGLPLRSR